MGPGRAGEPEPAHRLVLAGVCSRHICQPQVGASQGAQTLPGKVVDGDHNAPCCLQQCELGVTSPVTHKRCAYLHQEAHCPATCPVLLCHS